MEKLINKRIATYDYNSRYAGVPYFFDTTKNKDVSGVCRQISKDTPYVSHIVKSDDTLDSLALYYYNNPTFWWAIAYFNTILDPFTPLARKYKVIKIPSISSIVFEV